MIKNLEELQKYAELEGSELGEYCLSLINMCYISNWNIMRLDFQKQMQKEVDYQLDDFIKNCEIVEEEVTETFKRKSLKWFD